MRMIGETEREGNRAAGTEGNYTGFAAVPFLRLLDFCSNAKSVAQQHRTRVQDMPNSIARVNAFFIGGIASSSVSATPRGQRTKAASVAKSLVSPCVNAMPA